MISQAFKEIQALTERYGEINNIQVSNGKIIINYLLMGDIVPNYEYFDISDEGCIKLLEWIENNLTEWQ